MATIRLIPSTYYLSNSSYLSVTNESNMYTNTDSTTYGQVYNSRSSTSSYYIYLRGFNFDDVPSGAIINSFTIMFKAYESGASTSTSYRPYICDGTTTLTCSCNVISSSTQTLTFTDVSATWDELVGYGSDFGIRINCRRSSRNTASYIYIYGAEIEVDYTMPVSATVTSTLSGNGTISPSGAYSTYEDTEYTLTITPTSTSDTVSITKDGVDVTSSLVAHYSGGTVSTVLGTYTLESGNFNSGESYFEGIVGNGVDASETSSNYYSSSSSTQAVFTYSMAFTDIPSNVTIERVYCEVSGHAESSSNSNEYMCVQLKSGSTEISEQINFKDISTSNTVVTLEATTIPTVSQLSSLVLECTLGYYGGAINGATCYVVYSIPSDYPEYYTYTFTVTGDSTIAVTIGTSAVPTLYIKVNGSMVEVAKAWKKVNGSLVEQDVTTLFETTDNLVVG